MVAGSLYTLIDIFWIAQLGYRSVAAITVIMPMFALNYAVAVGTGVGANALASRRFGERRSEDANRVVGQVFFLSFAIGLLFALAMNIFPCAILNICGATPDIIEIGISYLRIFGWSVPFLFLQMMGRNIFQASGDAIRPMVFIIFGIVSNIILDPLFIFGWGFFPEMGIAGAALATVIASVLSAILAVYFIIANKTSYRLKLHHLIPHFPTIVGIYRVGLPSAVMGITETIVFVLFNNVVAGYGSVALAAVGIAGRISDLAFMFIEGLAHGLLPIVGYSLGAKLWSRLWRAVKLSSISAATLMAIATIILEIFTETIIRLFNDDPALIEIAVPGMRIFIATMAIIGPTVMFITTFQGLSRGKDAMVLALARQFIFFVPPLYILPRFLGLNGVWLSLPLSDILGFITVSLWLWLEYRRQNKSGLWLKIPN
jgi:putative MATE family efflux protein